MTTTKYAQSLVASLIISSDAFVQPQPKLQRTQTSSSLCMSTNTDQIIHQATLANKDNTIDRPNAQQIVNTILCPPNEERSRNNAGMEAFGQDRHSKVITNDDPRNEYTYGEFPFDSFDLLIDIAASYMDETRTTRNKMIDVGSGCGRLALYAGLTRSDWDVTGIEIGHQLHSLAVGSLQRGIDENLFQPIISIDDTASADEAQISFYNGNVLPGIDPYFQNTQADNDTVQSIMSQANLLFAYSTVWETDSAQSFNPELGAMVLSSKWSQTLASTCQNGVVAVTTDRVLNPEHGWKLLDRMDVDNPSVWGSVGYISVLEK
mmetsp:Transcript_4502/g.6887  ORF Transcript_4502/g.6887 Transcript_4502/m.6887 type:complete len:320 (-) Transcript_4502:364-1323(-)